MAWSNNLFYIVFISQIFLISYYIPEKILERTRHVLKKYPPSEYPKLYPRPTYEYEIGQAKFRRWNRIAVAIGFLTLFLIMFVIVWTVYGTPVRNAMPRLSTYHDRLTEFRVQRNCCETSSRMEVGVYVCITAFS